MILQIANVLSDAALGAVREALAAPSIWNDGSATAAGRAKAVKANEQSLARGPARGVLETIARAILENETLVSAALPDSLARIMLNRYGEDMEYGAHVDAPYIDGIRTDLAFTLFLSAPGAYDGGELLIDSAGAEDAVKLAAGSLVLYPATSVHRVARVTRGERLAAVGWIKSRVKSAEHRAMLFELDRIGADLAGLDAPGDVRDRLANLKNNLLRQWGE